MIVFGKIDNGLSRRIGDAILATSKPLAEERWISMSEWTSVIVSGSCRNSSERRQTDCWRSLQSTIRIRIQTKSKTWWIGRDDLHAREWRVISLFALLTVGVTNVVAMLLIEFVWVHCLLRESKRLIR